MLPKTGSTPAALPKSGSAVTLKSQFDPWQHGNRVALLCCRLSKLRKARHPQNERQKMKNNNELSGAFTMTAEWVNENGYYEIETHRREEDGSYKVSREILDFSKGEKWLAMLSH